MTVNDIAQHSDDMKPRAEKVTAFVTRMSPRGMEVLLFQHPSAGIQVPAGTVEADEHHAGIAAPAGRHHCPAPRCVPGPR